MSRRRPGGWSAGVSPASDEFAALLVWVLEHDWEEWDRQIERDTSAGKLESPFERARAAHRDGKSNPV